MDVATNDEEAFVEKVEQTKKKVKKAKRFKRFGMIIFPIFFFIGILIVAVVVPEESYEKVLLPYLVIYIVIGAICWTKGSEIQREAETALKKQLSDSVISVALGTVFENVQYNPEVGVNPKLISETDMGFPEKRIFHIFGSDWVKGTYKNIDFEFSDILITKRGETSPDYGTEPEITTFMGTWMICDFKKNLAADVIVSENYLNKNPFRKSIVTDNVAFNQRFTVQSDMPEEAFYVLTPHMMEFMMALVKKAMGKVYFHFFKDGRVCIAINSGKNLFELDQLSCQDYAAVKQQILNEIQYIVNILDALKEAGTMFEKRA